MLGCAAKACRGGEVVGRSIPSPAGPHNIPSNTQNPCTPACTPLPCLRVVKGGFALRHADVAASTPPSDGAQAVPLLVILADHALGWELGGQSFSAQGPAPSG